MARRIAAIVIRELACEIVRQRCPDVPDAMAVIIEPGDVPDDARVGELAATATLDVVSDAARRYGVRPGQKVTEATALTSGLAIHRVTTGEVDAALGRIAEIAMALGVTAAIRLDTVSVGAPRTPGRGRDTPGGDVSRAKPAPPREPPRDTVWLDITGAAHLVGGEEALAAELCDRVGMLGHRARVAVASGPRLAQALARYGRGAFAALVIAPGDEVAEISTLPVHCLPVDPDVASFLVRVGVLTVGDLVRLPRAASAARLGSQAALALELAAGRDATPLAAYAPPRVLEEATCFEEPVESAEALLFVLRGMTSRIGARLAARGEATARLEASILYDRSIARLRSAPDVVSAPLGLSLVVELPSPLADPADLLRPLRAKLERAELFAPAVAMSLRAPQIARARQVQLDLSRNRAASPDALPALLAELSAEIGADRVGVLEQLDAHRPEARSRLAPPAPAPSRARPRAGDGKPLQPRASHASTGPTRLLPQPVSLGRIARGAVALVDRQLFTIEELYFVMRLDGVEWWTPSPVARDYARAWMVSGTTAAEGWVFVDRHTGEGWLQGWSE